jgi:uncharacterized protein with HEPN domain
MPRDIRLYLDDMLEAIRAIRDYTGGMTFESFASDRKTIDAVVRNLEIIGEASRNLPEEIKDKGCEIEWRKIIGLRNLLIHEYFGISKPVVWDIVQNKLELIEKFCSNLLST